MKLKAIVVDDEEYSRKSLSYLVETYCPEIEVTGMASSVAEGRKLLTKSAIDIVFLDIAMPTENGFQLLPDLEQNETLVVFTTAYDQYAIRAIKASAIDYILKPVNIAELKQAVEKVLEWKALRKHRNLDNHTYTESLKSLEENINSSDDIRKISLPAANGFSIKDIEDIIYLEADNNYTFFFLQNGEKIIVSKPIREYEELLNPAQFFRIHKSNIINLMHVKDYSNKDGCTVLMQNQAELSVSRRRSAEFIERVKLYFNKTVYK